MTHTRRCLTAGVEQRNQLRRLALPTICSAAVSKDAITHLTWACLCASGLSVMQALSCF